MVPELEVVVEETEDMVVDLVAEEVVAVVDAI
jgi:hypothetical protein